MTVPGSWAPPAAPGTPPPPPPPPAPPARHSNLGRNIAIGVAVVLGLALIGTLAGKDKEQTVSAGHVTDTSVVTTPPTAPGPAPAATSAPTTTAPAPTTTTTAKPTTTTTSRAEAMVVWAATYADGIGEIGDTLTDLSEATGDYDITGMVAECRTLKRQVASAKANPPIPDPAVQSPWGEALRYYGLAADSCIRFGTTFDTDDLTVSANNLGKGADAMERATSALSRYTN